MGMIKHSQITQSNMFAILCNISKKKLEMEVIFGMQMNVKVSLQVGIILFGESGQTWHTQNRKLLIFLR